MALRAHEQLGRPTEGWGTCRLACLCEHRQAVGALPLHRLADTLEVLRCQRYVLRLVLP